MLYLDLFCLDYVSFSILNFFLQKKKKNKKNVWTD